VRKRRGIVFVGIGFELVAFILAAIFIGGFVENKYPSDGLWHAGFIILAFILWIIQVIVMLKKMMKDEE